MQNFLKVDKPVFSIEPKSVFPVHKPRTEASYPDIYINLKHKFFKFKAMFMLTKQAKD